MGGKMEKSRIVDFVDEFAVALRQQLEEDEKRWGDTWLRRPRKGQEARTMHPEMGCYKDYWDRFIHGSIPIPWLKVAGNALICWLREQHPELSELWHDGESESVG